MRLAGGEGGNVGQQRTSGHWVREGCSRIGLPRSTYYDAPPVKADNAEIVANITAICNEFEAYGYRRVGAELRHQGMVVNSNKIRRLVRFAVVVAHAHAAESEG